MNLMKLLINIKFIGEVLSDMADMASSINLSFSKETQTGKIDVDCNAC